MKIVMTSDTHKNLGVIKRITEFAKENNINTIVDCGDLHGGISGYDGIDLQAVYWGKASGGMDRWDFTRGINSINGTKHENGSTFKLDNAVFYIKHNLADYKAIIPEKAWEEAKETLERVVEGEERKFVAFGHTHSFHYNNEDDITAINPGTLGLGDTPVFVVLDTESGELEYRDFDKTILKIDKDFEFNRVRGVYSSKDNLRFTGRLKSSGKEVIQTNDHRTAEHKQIKSIEAMIDGVPMYTAVQDNDNVVLVKNDEVVAREYKDILRVHSKYEDDNVVGVTAFSAVKHNDKQVYVLEDGTESREFHKIKSRSPYFMNGKLCFVAKKSKKGKDLVIVDNKTIGQYKSVSEIVPLEDKVAVIVNRTFKKKPSKKDSELPAWQRQDSKSKQYLAYDSQKSKMYDNINSSNTKLVDGKLAFIAKENEESFVVHDGVEGPRFSTPDRNYNSGMSRLTEVGGICAYLVKQDNEEFIVHGDFTSEKVDTSDRRAGYSDLTEVDGKLAYMLKKDDNVQVFVDGKVVKEGKDIIQFAQVDSGEIACRRSSEGQCFIEVNGREFMQYSRLDEFVEAFNDVTVPLSWRKKK